jgi:hypothetical protein
MTNHEIIVEQFNVYLSEHAKLTDKGVKASAARARKAIQEITKAGKERRKEIMDEKSAIGS